MKTRNQYSLHAPTSQSFSVAQLREAITRALVAGATEDSLVYVDTRLKPSMSRKGLSIKSLHFDN